jgi:futalosine hydrolase
MKQRSVPDCLIIAATAGEIAPFINAFRQDPASFGSIDILISGIGLTATTWSLTRQIGIKRPDLVIQAGIAGCFQPSVQLGTVFVVKQDTIADLGVTEKNKLKTIFDLKLADGDTPPYKKGWLVNNNAIARKTALEKVTAVSVNDITTDQVKIAEYRKKFDPVLESMEGAALHYVCLAEKIPFIQLRAASNYIGERDKKKWMLKESVVNLNHQLTRLLYSI